MEYDVYLDKILLPIAPPKIQMKISNQNKTLNLINEGEINILKKAGLTSVDFEVLLPNVQYPFATYKDGFIKADFYLASLESLKTSQLPFQFIVSRRFPDGRPLNGTNIKVSLEDYQIVEDAKNGFDLVVSISLKQYRDYSTKACAIIFDSPTPRASFAPNRETVNSPAPKTNAKTYKVVKGDCLWNIAKMFYGNGNQYNKIFNANRDKIKNPNLIYPGQVLTIPV
ncbi:MAG: LysM peptidoglycan-binding domain-containing protein [Oscillospiraceae bacterium]